MVQFLSPATEHPRQTLGKSLGRACSDQAEDSTSITPRRGC